MRSADAAARDAVRAALRRAPAANRELLALAGVSPATAKRIVDELRPELVSAGETRRRKHALRRSLRGAFTRFPLFAIGEDGRATAASQLDLVQPAGCHALLDRRTWPQDPASGGWWDGLPYPLYDMRPQGYLGRLIAREHADALQLPANPDHWGDDEILWFLAHHGSDVPGNLVVGERAMQQWTRERAEMRPITARATATAYVERAASALRQAGAGSSAGGEFPKFTAMRLLAGSRTPHVIVKFSGADRTGAARRWADLLVCEHLASEALAGLEGHEAARSRILQAGGRTFLESERFDRHGDAGRSAVVTLAAAEAALVGAGPMSWPDVLRTPAASPYFPEDVVSRVQELWWFGRFVANTDMHHGNLGLRPQGSTFGLAPVYDMLPMRYAPLRGGDVPDPGFPVHDLPLPPRHGGERWSRVLETAIAFWREAASDSRISAGFRKTCAANAAALLRWADTFASATPPSAPPPSSPPRRSPRAAARAAPPRRP